MAKMLGVLPLLLVAAVATAEFARKPLMYLSNGAISYGYLQDEEVTEVCEDGVKSISGYFKIDGSSNKNYFFWMFEARNNPESAPTAVWLTGGPGCSSQLALLAENGPCKIDDDGKTTLRNLYSWNEHANIMWVDQPAGVGFSYGDKDDYDHNEAEVADDMYAFLNEMLKSHPEYAKNGLYLFAESYGGHYAPAIASRIVDGMRNDPKNLINLLGLGVGNGLTKPEIQYKYYPSMAVNNTKGIQTVSDQVLASMEAAVPQCIQLIEKCQSSTAICPFAQSFCNAKLVSPYQVTGRNVYDLTKQCEGQLCYDFSDEEQFLQADSTVEALHVAPEAAKWVSCNYNVNADFRADWMKNFDAEVANVLSADVSVLIYAGKNAVHG